jgi:acetyl esterase
VLPSISRTAWWRIGAAAALLAGAIAAFAAIAPAGRAPAANTLAPVERDVPYDGADGPELDVYRPLKGSDRAAVIVVHGGGWISGARRRPETIARALARAGFVAFNVDYTLAEPGQPGIPAQPRQVRAAVRFVRENASDFGVDPTRIGAFGSSAGGHLAALVGTTGKGPLTSGSRLRAVVTWSAPLSFKPKALRPSPHLSALVTDLLGCHKCARRAEAASPVRHVSPDDPPMLIVNSTKELVPAIQARWMASRLRATGVPDHLLMLPGHLHSPLYENKTLGPSISFLHRWLG